MSTFDEITGDEKTLKPPLFTGDPDGDSLEEMPTRLNMHESSDELPTMLNAEISLGRVDRYELIEKLGEGGFGSVYGARDTEANIQVALKALPSEISRDRDEMHAIRDNFALVTRLSHPSIAGLKHLHKVNDVDDHAKAALGVRRNDYLVVMEYASGTTLFELRRSMPEQKMSVDQALDICRPIADALDYAHSQRILHRDIKPKNIMVAAQSRGREKSGTRSNNYSRTNKWVVKVLDFGLAAEIRSSMSRKSKDQQNSKSGTPLYMAPEQWRGIRQSAATDQYALAILFYELVSGAVPFKSAFDSGSFEIMRGVVLAEPVPALKEVSKKQNEALKMALSKKTEERFQSCREFVDAISDVNDRESKSTRSRPFFSKWKTMLFLGLFGLTALFFYQPPPVQKQEVIQVQKTIPKRIESRLILITSPKGVASSLQSDKEGLILSTEMEAFVSGEDVSKLELKTENRYTLILSKPGYETYTETFVADWHGIKEKRVVISPRTLPFDIQKVPSAILANLSGLALGSSSAQADQKATVANMGLPLEVKSTKTDLAFRLIPAGSFVMGSPDAEIGRDEEDEKQHTATLEKPFYCGKFEVTQAQWRRVMGNSPSYFKNSEVDAPVEQVSRDDCQKFLQKLCQIEGVPTDTYRLLTESQWEYACRAGTTSPFCYGDSLDSTMANFDGDYPYGEVSKKVDRKKTVRVGQFKPNAFGLYDMHGNVWEWCSDWFRDYEGSTTESYGASSGSFRVYRGGAWNNFARSCRSALRGRCSSGSQFNFLGFRIMRVAPSRQ